MKIKESLLTTQQVAEIIGISPDTIARYRRQGNGPKYLRLGNNLIRYRRSDVEEWLDKAYKNSITRSF